MMSGVENYADYIVLTIFTIAALGVLIYSHLSHSKKEQARHQSNKQNHTSL